jgi:hypothetical protein
MLTYLLSAAFTTPLGFGLEMNLNRPGCVACEEKSLVLCMCSKDYRGKQAANTQFSDPGAETGPPRAVLEMRSFALYALSRGSGLSERGQRVLTEFRDLLSRMKAEGKVIQISDTRIGIEGETRICAKFSTGELAAQVWMITAMSIRGADLVQLKAEGC